MPARAAVAILVAEVGTRNDVQQTIRWCGVGVVVGTEKISRQIVCHSKGIPVSGGLSR